MDDIVFTQEWATNLIAYKPTEVRITKKLLHFPVKSGAPTHKVKIEFEGKTVRYFDIELAPGEPDFWVLLDVQQWKGKTLTIVYDKIHENR